MTVLRTLAFWTGVALLVALAILGFWSALGSLDSISTSGQRVATVTQFGYAVSAFMAAAALVARHAWARRLLWLWAALTTITGGLAPVVWGEARPGAGLAAAAASAAIAGLVARLATLRPPPVNHGSVPRRRPAPRAARRRIPPRWGRR